MPNLQELAERRAAAAEVITALGTANTPTDFVDRIKASAQMRLAYDALERTEREYTAAIDALSTDELTAIANGTNAKSA